MQEEEARDKNLHIITTGLFIEYRGVHNLSLLHVFFFMDACEVVRLFVNKMVVSPEPKRRGNLGYGRLKALRVLVYSKLKGLEKDTWIVVAFVPHV